MTRAPPTCSSPTSVVRATSPSLRAGKLTSTRPARRHPPGPGTSQAISNSGLLSSTASRTSRSRTPRGSVSRARSWSRVDHGRRREAAGPGGLAREQRDHDRERRARSTAAARSRSRPPTAAPRRWCTTCRPASPWGPSGAARVAWRGRACRRTSPCSRRRDHARRPADRAGELAFGGGGMTLTSGDLTVQGVLALARAGSRPGPQGGPDLRR